MLSVFTECGFIPIETRQDYYLIMNYDGFHSLSFDVSTKDPIVKYLKNEAIIQNEDNRFLIKNINRRTQNITLSCELDMDEWKETIFFDTTADDRFQTKLLIDILETIKPTGWMISNAGIRTIKRTPELKDATPFDILLSLESIYSVVFEINVLQKTLKVIDPNSYVYDGLYATPELNLNGITSQGSSDDFCTKLFAYGKTDDEGVTVNISSVNDGKEYIEDHTYSDRVVTLVWRDERYLDSQSLYDDARKKLDMLCIPKMSYDITINDLSKKNKDYDFLSFGLYKLVKTIIDEDISIIQRVVVYKKYYDKTENNVVTLSNEQQKLTSKISNVLGCDTNEIINGSFLDQAKLEATKIINTFSKKGYRFETENETYFLDKLPKEDAKYVMRINLGGIAFSTNGWSGPYITAWTIDGEFNADFITGGTIKGIKIIGNDIEGGSITTDTGNIAGFDLGESGFTKSTMVKLPKIYYESDLQRVEGILMGEIPATPLDLTYYDTDKDGRITTTDYIRIEQMYIPIKSDELWIDLIINCMPYDVNDINAPAFITRARGKNGDIAMETRMSIRDFMTTFAICYSLSTDYLSIHKSLSIGYDDGSSIYKIGEILADYVSGTHNLYILNEADEGYITLGISSDRIYFQPSTNIDYTSFLKPRADGNCTLGTTSNRFYNAYLKMNPNISSDKRLKRDFTQFDERYIKLYELLKPTLYHITCQSDSKSMHGGFIAQEVEEAMTECGIDKREFGIVKYDEENDEYSLIYDMFIPLIIYCEHQKEMKTNNKIKELEDKINKLLEKEL